MRKIFPELRRIMAGVMPLSPDAITPATRVDGLKYQELAAMTIACEKAFRIDMEDERIGDLHCVADWMRYIAERMGEDGKDYVPPTDEDRETWYHH